MYKNKLPFMYNTYTHTHTRACVYIYFYIYKINLGGTIQSFQSAQFIISSQNFLMR